MSQPTIEPRSPFARFHQRTLQAIPGYPGEHAVIQRLSDAALEKARTAVRFRAVRMVKDMGGLDVADLIDKIESKLITPEVLEQAEKNNAARFEKVKADPYLAYDRDTLIVEGVVSWSFLDPKKNPVPITLEWVEGMEEPVKEYFGRAIFALKRPTDDDEKKEPAPSSDN